MAKVLNNKPNFIFWKVEAHLRHPNYPIPLGSQIKRVLNNWLRPLVCKTPRQSALEGGVRLFPGGVISFRLAGTTSESYGSPSEAVASDNLKPNTRPVQGFGYLYASFSLTKVGLSGKKRARSLQARVRTIQ